VAAASHDAAHAHGDAETRRQNQAVHEFLVPLVKGYSTEMSFEVASLGVQVHGGMGYIEETGAAQYLRDARILTIYEGTTAIQANDLVGRKTARDGGQLALELAQQMATTETELAQRSSAACRSMLRHLRAGREAFEQVVRFMAENARANPNAAYAGAVPYLMLAGNVVAGLQMARALIVAEDKAGDDPGFMATKATTARFYAEHILTRAPGLRDSIVEGSAAIEAMGFDAF
jgi:3-(methylthio)propanoyl-CoA dehydrogenase